jgi:hypothetical protein
MSESDSKEPVRRGGPRGVAYAFLFAFALSVGTIIFTGLQVRAPDPERRQRLEAMQDSRRPVPAVPSAAPANEAAPGDAVTTNAADEDALDSANRPDEQQEANGGAVETRSQPAQPDQ